MMTIKTYFGCKKGKTIVKQRCKCFILDNDYE